MTTIHSLVERIKPLSRRPTSARNSPKEKVQFYSIALGSLTELEYYLDFSRRLEYLTSEQYNHLGELRAEVGRLLNGFIRSTKL